MNIAAEKISKNAFNDIIEIIESQPWLKHQLSEVSDLWNICQKREEQELLKSLIKRFIYFGAEEERNACNKIAEKIHAWNLDFNSTWIVAAANKSEIDGSTAGLQKLKNKVEPIENWHSRFIPNIPEAVEKISNGQVIVLFDDFIGSGKKLIDKSNWMKRLLNEKDITEITFYFISFSGMNFGVENLSQTTQCKVFSYLNLKKAISEMYPKEVAENLKSIMINIEKNLSESYKSKKLKDYSLGFGASETLYCAQNDNCPNNVFPVFWWPTLKNGTRLKTILKRAG